MALQTVSPPPTLKHLFTLKATVSAPIEFGVGPFGRRRCVPIASGTIEGPYINGKILPIAGADYMIVQDDSSIRADTRYTIETDDGVFIYAQTQGVRSGSPEALRAMMEGRSFSQDDYWMHLSIKLETGHEKYQWVCNRIIVARCTRIGEQIAYDAYYLANSA